MTDQELSLAEVRRALAGRYDVERRLGQGGMGIVFLARELPLDRRVALKFLPPSRAEDPLARGRFMGEARTAARLSHAHIVPIFAVHHIDQYVFYAMAYVEGETLGQRVRERGPLPAVEAARVLHEVASALVCAHEAGVVHRDVKPDNILIDTVTGRALVADFGIARAGSGTETTGPREVVGTAEFMSPEQAAGSTVDARSDVYSLGVVGFFALSGRLPFAAADGYAVLVQHLTKVPPPLSSVVSGIPRRLAAAVDRCLAKHPSARFATATEFAAAVDGAMAEYMYASPPLALRAFLVESKHLSTLASLYSLGASAALLWLGWMLYSANPGDRAVARLTAATGILVLPLALAYARVRRLCAAGFTQHDLADAIAAELKRRREELAFLYGLRPTPLERGLRILAYMGVAATVLATAVLTQRPASVAGHTGTAVLLGLAGGTLLAAVAARIRTEHRTESQGARRLRFWRSAVGRWLFRLAAVGLDRPQPAPVPPPGTAVGVLGERFFQAQAKQTT